VFCSIIQKAGNALEVLNEVLDAVDAQNPQVTLESFSYRICKTIRF
jgi:SpoU rRNA methylase family enzyme